MNPKQAADKLIDNWPHAKVTAVMLDSYQRVMSEVAEEWREKLITRLVDDHDFLPSVYLVRQTWKSMRPQEEEPIEELPQRAPPPDWVDGCYQCERGIVNAPPLTRTLPLYEERLHQARDGDLQFCGCQAGKSLRAYLLRLHKREQEFYKELTMAANAVRRPHSEAR